MPQRASPNVKDDTESLQEVTGEGVGVSTNSRPAQQRPEEFHQGGSFAGISDGNLGINV